LNKKIKFPGVILSTAVLQAERRACPELSEGISRNKRRSNKPKTDMYTGIPLQKEALVELKVFCVFLVACASRT
jgi:hypothetical protein